MDIAYSSLPSNIIGTASSSFYFPLNPGHPSNPLQPAFLRRQAEFVQILTTFSGRASFVSACPGFEASLTVRLAMTLMVLYSISILSSKWIHCYQEVKWEPEG